MVRSAQESMAVRPTRAGKTDWTESLLDTCIYTDLSCVPFSRQRMPYRITATSLLAAISGGGVGGALAAVHPRLLGTYWSSSARFVMC